MVEEKSGEVEWLRLSGVAGVGRGGGGGEVEGDSLEGTNWGESVWEGRDIWPSAAGGDATPEVKAGGRGAQHPVSARRWARPRTDQCARRDCAGQGSGAHRV